MAAKWHSTAKGFEELQKQLPRIALSLLGFACYPLCIYIPPQLFPHRVAHSCKTRLLLQSNWESEGVPVLCREVGLGDLKGPSQLKTILLLKWSGPQPSRFLPRLPFQVSYSAQLAMPEVSCIQQKISCDYLEKLKKLQTRQSRTSGS